MHNEHEPIRLPTWRRPLRAFEAARDAYVADPAPDNLRRAQRLGELLTNELRRPGRFALGQIVETIGAHNALAAAFQLPAEFLIRHQHGEWGELPPGDVRENEWSLEHGARLFSSYRTRLDEKLWVITEWDRSVTTLLLPHEY
jgi:hypothetical protein